VQRGFVVECTGRLSGRPVHASLYENDSAVNVVEVGIGAAGAAREVADIADLAHGGRVRAAVRLDGARARITGTLRVTGRPTRIRQEQDDAGQHIVAAGRHRAITAALRISFRGDTTRLECANAFQYRLRVTTTPTV
jgi:hypothetical protein